MNNGIQCFTPSTPPEVRRRRLIFFGLWVLTAAMVIWPLYPWLGARPGLVLGLPRSMAWMVLALAIQFSALLWLFFSEPSTDDEPAQESEP